MSFLYSSIEKRRKLFVGIGVFAVVIFIAAGVFAKNDWFPKTDAMSGQRYGWFGKKLPKNAASSWNPLAFPSPTPTPQLSREYIYAGSKLLAVEDANASAVPPADLAVWRPSSGVWWVLGGPGSSAVSFEWGSGSATDIPAQGDYDGDAKTDFAVFRQNDGDWWILRSSDSTLLFVEWGNSTDVIAQADFDGDGRTDPAVLRHNSPSSGLSSWWALLSSTNSGVATQLGTTSDIPVPADYDGDGVADVAVWRSSETNFYSRPWNGTSAQTIDFSNSGTPVSGDYDGDGKANYAIRNGAAWIIMNAALSSTSSTTPSGDLSTDFPVQNDYDGDGKCDIAVWRPVNSSGQTDVGNWYIRKSASSGALRQENWGTTGDIPVAAYYRR